MELNKNVKSNRIERYIEAASEEERAKMVPVPNDASSLLSEHQQESFNALKYMGWRLKFVRRVNRKHPLFIFENSGACSFAAIELNGDITINPEIHIRN